MALSPICQIKDGSGSYVATDNGVDVAGGDVITLKLVDAAGVDVWQPTCIGCDELQAAATVNAGISIDLLTKTATFTAGAPGSAYLFQSFVKNNGSNQTASATFKISVLTANNLRVGATNETTENDAEHGSLGLLNKAIRRLDTIVFAGVEYTLDGASAALVAGDWVCMVAGSANHLLITKALPTPLAAGGVVLGIVTASYAPGATDVQVGIGGTAPNSVTALGGGIAGPAYIDATARASRTISAFHGGFCDTTGKVTIAIAKAPVAHVTASSFATGQVFRGTTSNQAAIATSDLPRMPFAGIALHAMSSGSVGAFHVAGVVDPAVKNIGAGAAVAVGVDSSGNPVRATDPACVSQTNYLGFCDTNGVITSQPYRRDHYNALDYGLDNTGATDNVAANAALWALIPNGGEVYYPAGTYRFNSMIGPCPEGLKMRGAGAVGDTPTYSGTRFLHYGAGTAFRVVDHYLDQAGGGQHISDIEFIAIHPTGEDDFGATHPMVSSAATVLGAPYAGMAAVHYPAHGLGNGSRVKIAGCVANTGANGSWYVLVRSPDDFILYGSTNTGTSGAADGTIQFHDIAEIGLEVLGGAYVHIEHCVIGRFKYNLSWDGTEQGYGSYIAFGALDDSGYQDRSTDLGVHSGCDWRAGTFRFDPVTGPVEETSTIEMSDCTCNDHVYGFLQFDVFQHRVLNCRINGAHWGLVVGGQNCVVDSCESDQVIHTINVVDFLGVGGGWSGFTFSNNFWSLAVISGATHSWANTGTGLKAGLSFRDNTWKGNALFPAVIPNGGFVLAPVVNEGNNDVNVPGWTLLDGYVGAAGGNIDFKTINHQFTPKASLDLCVNNWTKPIFVATDTNELDYIYEGPDTQLGAMRSRRSARSAETFVRVALGEQVVDYLDLVSGSGTATFASFTSPTTNATGMLEAVVNVRDKTNDIGIGVFKLSQEFNVSPIGVVTLLGDLTIESRDRDGGLTDPLFVISGTSVVIQAAKHGTVPTGWSANVDVSWRGL